jgi:hypothetical protein
MKKIVVKKVKFFTLYMYAMKLEKLSSLATETVEVALAVVNLMTGTLLKQKLDALNASAAELRSLLDRAPASPLTAQLRAVDEQMNEKFTVIKQTLSTFVLYGGTPKAAAAALLMPQFEPYWAVMTKAYTVQQTKLKELHDRIASMGDYLEALTTLELMTTWLDFMALIDQFNALFKQRLAAEAAYQSASSLKDTVVTDYEAFCNTLLLMLDPVATEQLELLFDELNELRKRYAPAHRLKLDAAHTSTEPIPTQPYDAEKPVQPLTRVFYQALTEVEAKILWEPDPTRAPEPTPAHEPAVHALTEPRELEFTVDYEVSYKNNKKVGQATLIIHGKGKFTGQYLTYFYIE